MINNFKLNLKTCILNENKNNGQFKMYQVKYIYTYMYTYRLQVTFYNFITEKLNV